jgi:hypothetical protein
MKKRNIGKIAGPLVAIAVGIGASTSAFGAIIDLTTAGASGTIGIATFQQINPQSTGTGVIDPFLRIQAQGNETAEGAYNTGGALANPPFQQQGSGQAWNTDLLLSAVPIVNGSYQFMLDINQTGANPLLSLNQLQVFRTSTPGQTAGSVSANGYLTGIVGNSVYDMNPGGGLANGVKLDFSLNSGSGSGDMFLYIPTSAFAGVAGDYVVLYSHFGAPGTYSSNDGFEEWATLTGTPVPEPTTVVAGALLLLPFAVSTIRTIRKRRTA